MSERSQVHPPPFLHAQTEAYSPARHVRSDLQKKVREKAGDWTPKCSGAHDRRGGAKGQPQFMFICIAICINSFTPQVLQCRTKTVIVTAACLIDATVQHI